MRIATANLDEVGQIGQMARLLLDGFRVIAPDAWGDMNAALGSVHQVVNEGFARVALDKNGIVLGWVGGLPRYDGNVWELHPLVVAPAGQGQGIGRALVLDLEDQVRERGGLTVLLGSDDEGGFTSLGNVDLYDDLPGKFASAQGTPPHALEFYRKLGYTIVGVVPDANGRGKPDIIMAKRV